MSKITWTVLGKQELDETTRQSINDLIASIQESHAFDMEQLKKQHQRAISGLLEENAELHREIAVLRGTRDE